MARASISLFVVLALVAVAASSPLAQGAAQPPPGGQAAPAAAATQKPAEPAKELPADGKAFNAAAAEKDPMKRIAALEKFITDHPKSMLAAMARSQITTIALNTYKDSRAKYLALTEKEIADATQRANMTPLYFTYNSIASRLLNAGIVTDEAEEYARKGLAGMDEATYLKSRKEAFARSLASYEKAVAAQATPAAPAAPAAPATPPAAPTPAAAAAPATPAAAAAPATPAAPIYRLTTVDGVTQASLAPPAPPRPATPPRPPTKPTLPTDDALRASLKTERASAQATLGQILVKRGKTAEGEKILEEAYAAKPASFAMASIARTLSGSAKKAGNETRQLEFLTVLALTGRITADENKEFEALYRKTHNGSLDGLEPMLDEKYLREHSRFAVMPFARKAGEKPTGMTPLIEVFPGAG